MPENNSFWKILNALALSAGVSAAAIGTAAAAPTPEERVAYEAATSTDTMESLQEFLILFPDSDLAANVFQRLNAKIVTPAARTVAPPPVDPGNPQLALGLFGGDGPLTSIY